MPMMSEDMPMRRGPMGPPAETEKENVDQEKIDAFLPKEFFGGREPKPGEIERIKIIDVDPETGERQVQCEYGGSEGGGDEGYEAAFDKAMPEDESE